MTDSYTRATPATAYQSLAVRPLFSRAAWEQALLATQLPSHAKLTGLVLAHLADDNGYIPQGRVQGARPVAERTGLIPRVVRIAKNVLEEDGFLQRPSGEGWTADACRPVTLTLPAERQEPPHTGGRP